MTPRVAHRALLALLICVLGATLASQAWSAEPLTAPPASSESVERCGARAQAAEATAAVERVVRGIGAMQGCITDTSGIAHLFVSWRSADGARSGRICVDPPVRADVWQCAWDTTKLVPGSYTLTLTAVDAAGNRGSSDQAYRVEPALEEEQAAPTPEAPEPAQPAPDPDPAAPVEPAPVAPEPTDDPTVPVAPVDRAPGSPETMLEQLVADKVAECSLLELAPDVRADRALSIAVLDCMRPALEALGATSLGLDEIPVPPAIRAAFADAVSLDAAAALLPERVGGVELQLVLDAPVGDEPAVELPAEA